MPNPILAGARRMNGAKLVFYCFILWLLDPISSCEASPRSRDDAAPDLDPTTRNDSQLFVDPTFERANSRAPWLWRIAGLKVDYNNRELLIGFSPYGEPMENRALRKRVKRQTIMQRIGSFLMMIPISMQLLQLPMAIATVKMSLLRSLLIAKVALFVLFLRVLFMPKPQQKVVIVQTPPTNDLHQHYYHPFRDPEDDKPGWLGKGPAWMNSK